MKLLSALSEQELQGTRVLLRADVNVPIEQGTVVDDFRIQQTLPTIRFLRSRGARVRIIAHVGRDRTETLAPVAQRLDALLPDESVVFAHLHDDVGDAPIVLFENLRQDEREANNDPEFAHELAQLGDIFVQDAFAVCHRAQASITGIPALLPSYAGLLLEQEITHLANARTPQYPSLAVLGGAKFETKEPLIREFLNTHSHVFVGGALANEVLAAQGYAVGASRIEDGKVPEDILHHDKLIPITDVVVQDAPGAVRTCAVDDVHADETIVDIGPRTAEHVASIARSAHSIVWNGPLGWYEKGFTEASLTLARAIESIGKDAQGVCRAHVVVGGGDTVALLQDETLDACTFVSTGGGAMLDFLLAGTLPGIQALDR